MAEYWLHSRLITICHTISIGFLALFQPLQAPGTHVMPTHTCTHNTHKNELKKIHREGKELWPGVGAGEMDPCLGQAPAQQALNLSSDPYTPMKGGCG